METFQFVLIVLTCVAASSVIDKFVDVSIPVIQVVIGLLVALVLPSVQEVHLESELFMLVFIAPLLFNETRETNIRALLLNLNSILSLAIALVIVSVLSVGYALHLMVPSIPLAAAFALASALGPTDAATVTALKSNIHLTHRQQTLLSGESLINDASGVVAFQFSVAAAVTGAFSLVDAAGSFTVLFVGGVVMGIVTGFAFSAINAMLGRLGYEDTVANVLYEVLTPFLVYLLAETFHVSGVLAVVAAGLVIALPRRQSNNALFARQKLVSDSTWKVISFLINGTIFVFLGMQLPLAMLPGTNGGLNILQILGIVVVITLFMHGVRFAWLYALETHKLHKGGHLCTGKDAVDGEKIAEPLRQGFDRHCRRAGRAARIGRHARAHRESPPPSATFPAGPPAFGVSSSPLTLLSSGFAASPAFSVRSEFPAPSPSFSPSGGITPGSIDRTSLATGLSCLLRRSSSGMSAMPSFGSVKTTSWAPASILKSLRALAGMAT